MRWCARTDNAARFQGMMDTDSRSSATDHRSERKDSRRPGNDDGIVRMLDKGQGNDREKTGGNRVDKEVEPKDIKKGGIRKAGWRRGTRDSACRETGERGDKWQDTDRRKHSLGSKTEGAGTHRPGTKNRERMAAEGSRAVGRWMRSSAGDGDQSRASQDVKGKGKMEDDPEQFYIPVYEVSEDDSEDHEVDLEMAAEGNDNRGQNEQGIGNRATKRGRKEAEDRQEPGDEVGKGRRGRG